MLRNPRSSILKANKSQYPDKLPQTTLRAQWTSAARAWTLYERL